MPTWFPAPILAIILGAFAVALIVAWFKKQRETRRLEDVITWAAGRGFTVAAGSKTIAEAGLAPELTALPLFSRGRRQRVRNLIRGTTPEGALLLFDVRYVVQSGKHTTSIEQTVAAFERASPLPAFELQPEGFFSRLGQAFGVPDINLESHPEFSRLYQLSGPDAAAVQRLFEGEAATYLEQTTGWSIQAGGSWLIVFRHDKRPAVAQLSEYLETVGAIVRVIRQG
jgi:hypothetical protein